MKHTKQSLTLDLKKIGICKGDTLFLAADLSNIGLIEGNIKKVILNSLLDAVGEDGTIITNSFTKYFLISKIDKNYIFNEKTPSNAGALANLMLKHPNSLRSKHPSNSFVAIGKQASYILDGHDEKSTSYFPLNRISELGGKHMLLGCVDKSNGLGVIHQAQEALGLTKRNILRNRVGVYFEKNGKIELFKRKDLGGCSKGFYKFYNLFVLNNVLKTGYIGDAYSVLVDSKEAFEIVYETLKENPRFTICDDKNCSCRGKLLYNKRAMPYFYLRYFYNYFKRKITFKK